MEQFSAGRPRASSSEIEVKERYIRGSIAASISFSSSVVD